jgi:hypothetical protein
MDKRTFTDVRQKFTDVEQKFTNEWKLTNIRENYNER